MASNSSLGERLWLGEAVDYEQIEAVGSGVMRSKFERL